MSSGQEWKMKLHLNYADELRSMAGKMRGVQTKAMLLSAADDHEQVAKSLERKAISDHAGIETTPGVGPTARSS